VVHVPNFGPGDCCNRQTGEIVLVDDGIDCTEDLCQPDGTVLHPPSPAFTPCGDPSETACDRADTCDGAGVCLDDIAPDGPFCIGGECQVSDCESINPQTPGDCNQDGICDLSDGICVLGFLFFDSPLTLPCGDGSVNDPGNLALMDWNGNGNGFVDLSDAVGKLQFLFLGGPEHGLGLGCIPMEGCPDACSESQYPDQFLFDEADPYSTVICSAGPADAISDAEVLAQICSDECGKTECKPSLFFFHDIPCAVDEIIGAQHPDTSIVIVCDLLDSPIPCDDGMQEYLCTVLFEGRPVQCDCDCIDPRDQRF
jgi:hypothetical protein